MKIVWCCIINCSICLAVLSCVSSSPAKKYNQSDEYAVTDTYTREKRQISSINSFYSKAVYIAIGMMLCTSDPAKENSKSKEDAICTIDVRVLKNKHALIVDPLDHKKLIYPDERGMIKMFQKESVFLSCPGKDNNLRNVRDTPQHATFTCVCGEAFEKDKVVYDFKKLDCAATPQYTIKEGEKFGEAHRYREFIVGFQTDGTSFSELININYDRWYMRTVNVKSMISKSIAGSQKTSKNLRFDQTFCCETEVINLDDAYKIDNQKLSFATQLECQSSDDYKCNYIDETKGYVFNRGHLSPKSTFVYTSSGQATFVYLNSAPQWQAINDGNWARIEEHVTEMAKILKKDLTVFTGIWDVLHLKDTVSDGKDKNMILYDVGNGLKALPIPLYFWKVVYDPHTNKGVMFVTVNNPYIENPGDYHLCKNPMQTKNGVKMPRNWRPTHVTKGYSYMCEIADFVNSNELPIRMFNFDPLSVNDLLYIPKPRVELRKRSFSDS